MPNGHGSQEKNTRLMSRGTESLDVAPVGRTWPFGDGTLSDVNPIN